MELHDMIAEWVASNKDMERVHEYYSEEVWYDKKTKIFYKLEDEIDGQRITEINQNSNKYSWYVKRYLSIPAFRRCLEDMFRKCVSSDYTGDIIDNIIDDVIEDVELTADEEWNEDDIKLAVGRVICDRLNIEH